MLNKIKLTNFQRHRNLEVVFSGGLQAVRGANEAGKSTLLRAIAYAMGGVKALNESLEDLVTWGEEVKTLRVDLELAIDGVVYAIKRSKGGAEVNYDGGSVTGQNEVTAFVAKLLRMEATAVPRLILSNQNAIRGALEAGPKATTELIEKLAEFDVIDNLVEKMEEHLELGSTAGLEIQLSKAEQDLDAARENAVEPDTSEQARVIASVEGQVAELAAQEAAQQSVVDAAVQAVSDARVQAGSYVAADTSVTKAMDRLTRAETALRNVPKVEDPGNVDEQVDALNARIAAAKEHDKLLRVYGRMMAQVWTGEQQERTYEDLSKRVPELADLVSELQLTIARKKGDAKVYEQALLSGSCSFCGQDFSNVPKVAAENAKTQEKLDAVRAEIQSAQEKLDAVQAEKQALTQLMKDSEPIINFAQANSEYVNYTPGRLPPVLHWVGPTLSEAADDADELQQEIRRLRGQREAFAAAEAAKVAADRAVKIAGEDLESAKKALALVQPVDLTPLQAKVDAERARLSEVRADVVRARQTLSDAKAQITSAQQAYERAKRDVQRCEFEVARLRESITKQTFNNGLLKKVRTARPLIADKLWNLVLSTVSSYFTEMRGEESVVTKDADGFKVNGHTATTLSGSALDILGLAIRVALVRTFTPTSTFLILDEPAAACSDERTSNMLGFLSGCGFQQILLVTHEEVSQSVADNIVYIGG